MVFVYELEEHNGGALRSDGVTRTARAFTATLRSEGPCPLAQKVVMFAQICDALAEATGAVSFIGISSRGNISLHENMTAKILDFGLAGVPGSRLTIAGKVSGTPNYMAPEQINLTHCDSRSDLFSAAIVFFEFLVYAHPFQSSFIPRRIVVDGPDALSDHDPFIPKSLTDLLHRALQKRPENRIQTAEEFAAGLRAVLQSLRTGLATEPAIEDLSSVPPSHQESPDSPAARLAAFVQMLSDFDGAVLAADVALARAVLGMMIRLEASDDRFRKS